jgi:uncharacterized protein (DUF1499 family)
MNEGRSKLASVAFSLAILAAVAVVAGPLAIHARVASPFLGFRIFGLGLVASLPLLLLSIAALVRTRGPARREGRSTALRATLLSGVLALAFALLAAPGMRVPPIHDISTDPEDPPQFVEAARAPENAGDVLGYPRETAPQQRTAYPDVMPIRVRVEPSAAFANAQRAAAAVGWEIVRSDPAAGSLEATATSKVFLFVDDVSVRLRPEEGGTKIDVRSRSRVGKSDMGANAARIRAFAAAVGTGGAGGAGGQ